MLVLIKYPFHASNHSKPSERAYKPNHISSWIDDKHPNLVYGRTTLNGYLEATGGSMTPLNSEHYEFSGYLPVT